MSVAPPDAPRRAGPRPEGLYVHVPFCVRACPYCDFDFEVGREAPVADYLEGLAVEAAGKSLAARRFATAYVGGGTPSALGLAGLDRLLGWLADVAGLAGVVREWTVELNPEHVDPKLARMLRRRGVTRASLGAQSFDAGGLRILGRVHEPAQAARAARVLVEAGLEVSLDLMVGWPGQGAAALGWELDQALELPAVHLSVYALTIEPNTPWHALVRRGRCRLPDPDAQAERLLQVEARLRDAGFEHYEISNYGREGARGRHNELYWSWCDYEGLGPSAHAAHHGEDGSVRRRGNRRGFSAWRAAPLALDLDEHLPEPVAAREGLWLGLRRLEGLAVADYLAAFPGRDPAWLEATLAEACAVGWLRVEAGRVRLEPGAWLLHDRIARTILALPEG